MASLTDYYVMIVKYLFMIGGRVKSDPVDDGANVTIVSQDQTRVQEIERMALGWSPVTECPVCKWRENRLRG
jgi:type 1 glutamine amidotransferase